MGLHKRLDALRRQGGGAAPAEPAAPSPTRERLQRLRPPGKGTGRLDATDTLDTGALASRLGGEAIARRVVRIDWCLPIRCPAPMRIPGQPAVDAERWVFLDTETSGLASGTGTVAFMIGLGWIRGAELCLRQYVVTAFSGEAAMLEALCADLAGCEGIVTYNGKSFDAPLLRDRLRLHGRRDGFGTPLHMDLLHPVRALFAGVWPDCRLATAERRLLGQRRRDDLPGAEAPGIWRDLVRHGETRRVGALLAHNRDDISALPALLAAVAAAYRYPCRYSAKPQAAARAWCREGDEAAARLVLSASWRALSAPGRRELARLHRRCGEWSAALAIWEQLAAGGCSASREDLAKYQEHVVRDWRGALRRARGLPESERARWRRRRLEAKLARRAADRQLGWPW